MSLSALAQKLLDLEKSLRELATDLQLGRKSLVTGIRDVRYSETILEEARSIANQVREDPYVEKDDKIAADAAFRVLELVREGLQKLETAMAACASRGLSPRECKIDYSVVYKIENAVMELTGKPCAFKVSDTVTSALNDIAACVHRLAEKVFTSFEWTRDGKCYFAPSATEDAKLLCKMWEVATEELHEENMYHEADYKMLFGYAVGDRVYLTVGAAEEHRTEIDLARGTLKYYDVDKPVNMLIAKRLEEAGLSCRVHDFGVECTGVRKDDREQLAKIALAIATATSADFRLSRSLKNFYAMLIAKNFDKIRLRV